MSFLINATTKIDGDRLTRLNSGASGSRPSSPSTGMMFFNTTSGKIEVWNGAAWKEGLTQETPIIPVWVVGNNFNGRLGDGTDTYRSSPVSILGGFTDWIQVSTAYTESYAIRAGGTVWAWGGENTYGHLGTNSTVAYSSPVSVVGGFTDWVQVSAGTFYTLGIRANGTAWSWGFNGVGNLGDGSLTNRSSPVSVVGGFTDWFQISAGSNYASLAIRTNGTAWGWGRNDTGELGDNTVSFRTSPVSVVGGFTNWVQISSGNGHTAAIRANGTAWTWGKNQYGQIGNNTVTNTSSPVSVIGGYTDWVQIDAANDVTLGIRANGTAWAWGRNHWGQVGDNTVVSRSSPVSIVGGFTDWVQLHGGSAFTSAIRANGTAWAWGRNDSGTVGDDTVTHRSSPVSVVGGFSDWIQVASGAGIGIKLRSQPKYVRTLG